VYHVQRRATVAQLRQLDFATVHQGALWIPETDRVLAESLPYLEASSDFTVLHITHPRFISRRRNSRHL